MVDQGPVTFWPWTSPLTVKKVTGTRAKICALPHSKTMNAGDCRACWNRDIPNVEYAKH